MIKTISGSVVRVCLFLIATVFASNTFAQTIADSNEREWNIRPSIFIGTGMLSYQGDILNTSNSFNPFQNKLSLTLGASQPVNNYLSVDFFMLFGELGANERSLVRNLNFESKITAGGLGLSYNFDQFLKPERNLEPFISLGFEAFEFISKTDRFDSYGNAYNYWSDGTIRNLPETEENLTAAIEITRDYVYETDIRALNRDGFGNYSQRSFAIPVGAGFNLLMNEKMKFSMGVQYHWTFTDYVDGITVNSRGIRAGNSRSDRFINTFAKLTYDLTPVPRVIPPDNSGQDNYDSDLDSVPDFADLCPNTPIGIEVNEFGCPLDTDQDGVYDYLDAELNSPPGSVVDSAGVALSDAAITQLYLEYKDEKGKYAKYTNESYSFETGERKTERRKTSYAIKIGEFEEGIDDSLANILLSMPDVTIKKLPNGKTIIEIANIESLPEAIKRKVSLESSGIATTGVVENSAGGSSNRVTDIEQNMVSRATLGMDVSEAIAKNKSLPAPKKLILDKSQYTLNRPIDERSVAAANDSEFGSRTVYRIQIGAFANKLADDVFDGINDLLVITTSDGLTRYYTGAFTNYPQAASRKIDMIQRGFSGAYVVPFKNGQKVSLQSTGVEPADNVVPLNPNNNTSVNKGKVKFMIQIGAYRNQIPSDVLNKMMELGKIEQEKSEDGTVKYFTGSFDSYEEAKTLKMQLNESGFSDAFVVSKFNGRILTANEGIDKLK